MSKIINLHNSINKYFSDFETKYLENIILDKNYNIVFDHTINFNGYFVNGLIYNKNNEITIKINPYSNESILFILMHEITHAIDKNKLKELVINYLIQELELIEDDYIVSDELICDIAGVLLGNTKFLNYLYYNSNYNIVINNNYDRFINDFLINWEYCYKNNLLSITDEIYYEMASDSKYGSYWIIEDSKDIFKNENRKELRIKTYDYIFNGNKNFNIFDKIDNKEIKFTRKSANEYLRGSNSKQLTSYEYNHKMRLSTSLDDLINNAKIKYYSPRKHKNKLFKNGFNNYQGQVQIDNTTYRYIIRIGKGKYDSIFYDMSLTKIK